MANPFIAKFNSRCHSCGGKLYQFEDKVYAFNGMFICSACATEANVICKCGNFKKENYEQCFDCGTKKGAPEEEDEEYDKWQEKL